MTTRHSRPGPLEMTRKVKVSLAVLTILAGLGLVGVANAAAPTSGVSCVGSTVDADGHFALDCVLPALPTPDPTPTGTSSATPTAGPTTPPATTAPPTATPSPTAPPTTVPPTTAPPTTAPPAIGWPDASTTGVPSAVVLTPWTGSCIIATAQTITGRSFACDVAINAAVNIVNSAVAGTVSIGTNGSLVMTDSEVNASPGAPRQVTGVGDHDFTLTRVEIRGGNRGAYCADRCTIRDSWVHGQRLAANWHASAVRMEQRTTLIHNTLVCDAPNGGGEQSCSASLTGYGDFAPVKNNLIQGNYFPPTTYSAFCAYGGSSGAKPGDGHKPYGDQAEGIVFRDNVFGVGPTSANRECALYGPIADFDKSRPGNLWTNNRWSTGAVIPVPVPPT